MAYDTPPPAELPAPGYYYHFKHDPDGPLNNYACYIYGVGHHTEGDCRAEDAFMQVYRPLYEEAYAYRNGGLFDLRPLHMFFEPAEWKGEKVPRFTKIVDEAVIAQLAAIKARMYPPREASKGGLFWIALHTRRFSPGGPEAHRSSESKRGLSCAVWHAIRAERSPAAATS